MCIAYLTAFPLQLAFKKLSYDTFINRSVSSQPILATVLTGPLHLICPEGIRQAGKNLVPTGMNILKTFLDSEHSVQMKQTQEREKLKSLRIKNHRGVGNSYISNLREGNNFLELRGSAWNPSDSRHCDLNLGSSHQHCSILGVVAGDLEKY